MTRILILNNSLKCNAEDDLCFRNGSTKRTNNLLHQRSKTKSKKKMNLSIFHNTVEFVTYADFHSIIMVDETSDVSSKKQAVFCIRWVDEYHFLYEYFLGLHGMEKTDITSIADFIKDIILLMSFDGKQFRGSYYDGCTI